MVDSDHQIPGTVWKWTGRAGGKSRKAPSGSLASAAHPPCCLRGIRSVGLGDVYLSGVSGAERRVPCRGGNRGRALKTAHLYQDKHTSYTQSPISGIFRGDKLDYFSTPKSADATFWPERRV